MSIRLTLEGITPDAYRSLADGDWSGYKQTRLDERIDTDWQGLQIMLCGPGPGVLGLEELALQGGLPVDDPSEEDYGGAFVLPPHLVRMIAARLAETDDDDIERTCARTPWEGTYYGGIPAEDVQESMIRAFHILQEFFTACAEAGDGVLRILG